MFKVKQPHLSLVNSPKKEAKQPYRKPLPTATPPNLDVVDEVRRTRDILGPLVAVEFSVTVHPNGSVQWVNRTMLEHLAAHLLTDNEIENGFVEETPEVEAAERARSMDPTQPFTPKTEFPELPVGDDNDELKLDA